MCTDPIMLGITALSGVAQYRQVSAQSKAQEAAYNAQAAADEQNAKNEEGRQRSLADSYAQQANELRSRMRLVQGQQRASGGAAGIDMGAGTGLDLLGSSHDAYYQDQQSLLTNQRNDNYTSRTQQVNYLNSAAANRSAAANARSQGKMAKFGTILGTAASMYGVANTYKTVGGASRGGYGGLSMPTFSPILGTPNKTYFDGPFAKGKTLSYKSKYFGLP